MTDTTIKLVDIESIDEFFPELASESVIVPVEKAKPTVLTNEEEVDLDPTAFKKSVETKSVVVVPPVATPAAEDEDEGEDVDLSFEALVEETAVDNKKAGRAKTDKSAIVDLFKKKIISGDMVTFDDYDEATDLEEYLTKLTKDDLEALWDANIDKKVTDVETSVPQEFFNSLPKELQYAAKYVADGGKNLKELFKALAQVEEVRDLDVTKDAKEIAYQYLKASDWGTEEQIQEQISEWEDLNNLDKKAATFKPKLDIMHERIVDKQLADQATIDKNSHDNAVAYYNSVQTALEDSTIAGIKLDKKTNDFLTQGLLNAAYPALNGKKTNLLGHLLEKYQVVEPDHKLIAEVVWLLSDPAGYREKLAEKGKTAAVIQQVRQLKTEQSNRQGSTATTIITEDTSRHGLRRPGTPLKNNMFKR